ncbi:alpha/beta hydrolase [Sulfitobacter sp. D35]|uniref:alpha/beta hydrolase n=1 Tax=Sulfitobacter sp. D35 TaxID=3083252 RepID=UPI00296E2757|nr:alpha/beta hydrolase [Sulfitobacter sp. D35]MDW4496987.1 alpha/beta hydrolase [Sulfitobacter sp. D35]
MRLTPAQLFTDVHPGPANGAAHWVATQDGKRVRLGHWLPEGAARGTVLLFPGRTEYIEKYGVVAGELTTRGHAVLTIDWRGQGLADRMLGDPRIGHVDRFPDYQKDVAAMVHAARELNLPRPFYLLAHSMGGAIALRAAMEGLAVQAAVFTGPMWGIRISRHLRPIAWSMSQIMPLIGQGSRVPPGSKLEPYVLAEPFEDNMLTTDEEMYDMMRDQIRAHPELALGGPSFVWLREALAETAHLERRPSPNLPTHVFLGSNERIVQVSRIHDRMQRWKQGRLEVIDGGEHEVLMESREITRPLYDRIASFFEGHRNR